ncbi:MAG: TIGR03905 family TSCPD domain-containing protein [Bacilli bacterium]|jgi:uncharacterized protein (TIGR03905 family)
MVKTYTHICHGTCSRSIDIEYDTETKKLINVSFVGGCNGNLKGINQLVKGMDMNDVHDKLIGVMCGSKNTSCPNQLAIAIEEIKALDNL